MSKDCIVMFGRNDHHDSSVKLSWKMDAQKGFNINAVKKSGTEGEGEARARVRLRARLRE